MIWYRAASNVSGKNLAFLPPFFPSFAVWCFSLFCTLDMHSEQWTETPLYGSTVFCIFLRSSTIVHSLMNTGTRLGISTEMYRDAEMPQGATAIAVEYRYGSPSNPLCMCMPFSRHHWGVSVMFNVQHWARIRLDSYRLFCVVPTPFSRHLRCQHPSTLSTDSSWSATVLRSAYALLTPPQVSASFNTEHGFVVVGDCFA
jgi:hypothetical protein